MLLGIPSGVTEVGNEPSATRRWAGAGPPDRGADGCRDRRGLPVGEPSVVIVDIGGGTTEVAVISLQHRVSRSIRSAATR
jgi:hypothetical protein